MSEAVRSAGGVCVVLAWELGIAWLAKSGYAKVRSEGDGVSVKEFGISALCIYFFADAHFYWTHRLLHAVPWLYRNIHSVHHRSWYGAAITC